MLKQVIEAQGVEVGEAPFRQYPELIGQIKPAGVVVLTHTGGSGNAVFYNRWDGRITINGTTVSKGGNLTLAFEEGDNAIVVFDAEDQTVFQKWPTSYFYGIALGATSGLQFELTFVDVASMVDNDGNLPSYAFAYFISSYVGGSISSLRSVISSIAPKAMNFSVVKTAGRGCFADFAINNTILQIIPEDLFFFPNLQEADIDVFYQAFNTSIGGLIIIEKNNFVFPKLNKIGSSFMAYGFQSIHISNIQEGCFEFPQLKRIDSMGFYQMFLNCHSLTQLPIGSFNWGNNLTNAGSNFLTQFAQGSGISVPGNGMVQIYTPVAVSKFDGTKNYSAGSTIYVNGAES